MNHAFQYASLMKNGDRCYCNRYRHHIFLNGKELLVIMKQLVPEVQRTQNSKNEYMT